MKIIIYIFAAVLLLFGTVLAYPSPDRIVIGGLEGQDPSENEETYPVMLALSGGGARGISAIGILKAFEEKNIKVSAIAGTSIGGVIGGLYACGYTPEQLIDIIHNTDFSELFSNQPNRLTMFLTQRQDRDRHLLSVRFDKLKPYIPQALTAGQKLTSLLTSLTIKPNYLTGGDFLRFPVPFKTVCTDIVSGREEIIDSGSLAEALRASMAFPLAFTGVEREQKVLMDGGMMIPVPVDIVRQMNDTVAFVVAVNTTSPLLAKEELKTPIDIANQVTSIMTADQLADQLRRADLVIEPPLDDFTSTDFENIDSLIDIGYRAGLTAADEIIDKLRQKKVSRTYLITQLDINSPYEPMLTELNSKWLNRSVIRRDLIDELKKTALRYDLYEIKAVIIPDSAFFEDTGYRLKLKFTPTFPLSQTGIFFKGNHVFSADTLLAQIPFTDTVFHPGEFEAGLDSIISLYRSRGYDLADVRKVTMDCDSRTVTVVIDEALVKKIKIENNRRTKDWLILANFPLKEGEPYSTRKANRGIANIYATDLFDRVTMDLIPYDSGALIKIGVLEKKFTQLRLGWHWDDEYQSEEFAELRDGNVLGIGMEYLLHARYGRDRQEYFTKLKVNRIFSTYLTAQMKIYHDRLDRTIWLDGLPVGVCEENTTGATVRVGQQISRLGTVTGGIIFENIEYYDNRDDSRETLNLRKLVLESLVENFNRIPFPETGKKHLFELQLSGKYLGGEVEFTRYFSSIESYFPLGDYINYHPKLSIGLSRTGLPPSEKFYMGGMYSFSGFRTHELSGDKIFLLNQELRFKLPFRFYFTLRYDIGDIYTSSDEIRLEDLYHGFGVSIAFDSPIGPFDFGYGIADTDDDRFYFNAGFAF
ncbi:MAG: patatin-like phospholipase family protein [candidate division Zixibacteria bacterium]|nr:patatin-like phospholipase family protein [candidate division Zixibacteria bacterium]